MLHTESRHSGKSCESATIDPMQTSQVALESAWRMYFSVNIIVSLFRDLHASDKQVRLVSRRSMGSTTRLLMSRDLAKM
jgi:hypothetical protein